MMSKHDLIDIYKTLHSLSPSLLHLPNNYDGYLMGKTISSMTQNPEN
jgi:hypothetical protein